jgi:hypothetical protein
MASATLTFSAISARNLASIVSVAPNQTLLALTMDNDPSVGQPSGLCFGSIVENPIELSHCCRSVADLHRPYFAYVAATAASLANLPRRAATSSASSPARSCRVGLVGGCANNRTRSEISNAIKLCWSGGNAETAATAFASGFDAAASGGRWTARGAEIGLNVTFATAAHYARIRHNCRP